MSNLKVICNLWVDDRCNYQVDRCQHPIDELVPVARQSDAMAIITKLEQRLELSSDHKYDGIDTRDATIKELESKIEGLEKDAARYQWLRAQHWNDSAFAVVSESKRNEKLGTYCPSEDRLDQEIDSAMGADHEI